MNTVFDKNEEYNENVKKHVAALKKACIEEDIPFFLCVCVKNDDEGTKYKIDSRSALVTGKTLKDDWFPEFMKITTGMKADVQRPSIEVLFDD